jgi:hypothetical protein
MGKNIYDIWLRNAIAASRKPIRFPELNISRSTVMKGIRVNRKTTTVRINVKIMTDLKRNQQALLKN